MASFSVLSKMKMIYGFLALFAEMCYDGHGPDRHRVATVVFKSNHMFFSFFSMLLKLVYLCFYCLRLRTFVLTLSKNLHCLYEKSNYGQKLSRIKLTIKPLTIFTELYYEKKHIFMVSYESNCLSSCSCAHYLFDSYGCSGVVA